MANYRKDKTTKTYSSIGDIFCDLAMVLSPPESTTVADAAERYRYVNQPGAYVGKWWNFTVPYMVEPMNLFTSLDYEGIIFCGPAQCAKTDSLILNTIAYSVKIDPMDMIVYSPGMTEARDFGIRRVDRLHLHSPEIGEMLLPRADADNRLDKQYSTGMLLTLSWPTKASLAGKPIGRQVITDRDRMDDDIEGDGEVFDLAKKRGTTFGSYAMTVCESSPSRPITNLKWIAKTAHEAPPCEGILKLYNRGDRRRLYWPCPHCGSYFEGMFKHLKWTETPGGSFKDTAETVYMECPINHCRIEPEERWEMLFWSVWVKDGQGVDKNGRVFGEGARTSIASFWLRGVAAAFMKWSSLVENYLQAEYEYDRTGSEEALRKFWNTDMGEPYIPKSQSDLRLPEILQSRAEAMAAKKVPYGVRFLIATVDVQQRKFVVQVFGIVPGKPKWDVVIIDRFDIRKSKRLDPEDMPYFVRPHAEEADWDLIQEQVVEKEYELDDGSGRMMSIRYTGCDSGGRAGATSNAYGAYRRWRAENKHRRFILLKGDPSPNQPRVRITYPDSQRKDMKNAARGDIPVLMLNSNLLKDELDGRLDAITPGSGMFVFPDWLSPSFYAEYCVETRGEKGWENESGQSNESWDLSYYLLGICISEYVGIEGIDWDKPPKWAAEWDSNSLVRHADKPVPFAAQLKSDYDFASLGRSLA